MADDTAQSRRRSYSSPVRQERAARTREAILNAAGELFETEGFAATTIAAVAARAGVSAPTVYSVFGSKAGVVRAILGRMESSPRLDALSARIDAATAPEQLLGAFAEWTVAFFAASRPVAGLAAAAAPELGELMVQGNAHRRAGVARIVERLGGMDALRRDLDRRDAVDRVWILTGVETFMAAVQGCGWTESACAAWLAQTLAQQVLKSGSSVR